MVLMGIGILLLILGFIYTAFNTGDIFSYTCFVSAVLIISGCLLSRLKFKKIKGNSITLIAVVLSIISLVLANRAISKNTDAYHYNSLIKKSAVLINAGKYEEAQKLLEPNGEEMKMIPEFHNNLACAYIYQGNDKEHNKIIRNSKMITGNDPDFCFNTGIRFFEQEELDHYEHALAYFERAIVLDPDMIKPYIYAGITCIKLEKFIMAEYYLKKSIELNNNVPESHYWLGVVYYNIYKHEEARKELQYAKKINSCYVLDNEIDLLINKLK
jgi:tetratricopeptide (TPR) repeat protein